ncbi:UvrD-helicase domain-containing protein, partial [bacterium]|nr:UvrD-helicase domain-containing protein [bacterium]
MDGHRKCQTRMSPEDTFRNNGLCPVCGKPVTVGVLNRVNALADRPIGYRPENAPPFYSLIPLPEIISEVHGVGPNSKTVQQIFHRLLDRLGPELDILMQLPLEEIGRVSNDLLVEGIRRVRENEIHVAGGYDGEFGTVHIFEADERERLLSQTAFLNDPPPKVRKKKDPTRPNLIREVATQIERQQDLFLDNNPPDMLFQLNSSQMAAMTTIDQPLLIIAGPGTGKTRTLTHRLAYLVREKNCPPESILAITFTRYAANEMRERLSLLLPDQADALTIGTFHSIGYQILAEHADLLGYTGKFSILSDSDRYDILRYLPFDFSRQQIRLHAEQISLAKNRLQTATDFSTTNQLDFGDHFSSVFQQYEVVKKQMNGLDYDDLLLLPYQLLSKWPVIAAKYQSRYKWIAVDEYQDINLAQYHFLRVLMGADTNICAIGDPNQAIYGFRGADTRYFDQFTRDFPKAKSVELSENYRSSRMILNASSQMISANPQVARQDLWSKIPGKTRIEIIHTPT